jgi:hypothetical protein
MKFVSIRTRYGGTRAVLWERKSEEGIAALYRFEMMEA